MLFHVFALMFALLGGEEGWKEYAGIFGGEYWRSKIGIESKKEKL